jgi:hypothetical protein
MIGEHVSEGRTTALAGDSEPQGEQHLGAVRRMIGEHVSEGRAAAC